MAIVFMEGFDHLTAAQMAVKGWDAGPGSVVTGRFGGQAARVSTGTTIRSKSLPSTYTTLIVGFACRTSAASSSNFFQLRTAAAGVILSCRINNSSSLIEILNGAGTVIATGTTVIAANTWNYIEIKAFVNGASGTVEVRLNGAAEIASTTVNIGSTAIGKIGYGKSTGSSNDDIDDMYAADTTGSAPNNTFLGDRRVQTIYPSADGANSQWTPTGGGAHYTQVNETTPDDDTTYVSDSTPNHLDTYAFGDIDGGATVHAIQTNLYARKDDAATRQIAPVIRQSGTDNAGTTVTLSSTYSVYSQIYNTDPASAAWTAANVNGDEFGVKEIA